MAAAEAAGLKVDQATRERIGKLTFQELRGEFLLMLEGIDF